MGYKHRRKPVIKTMEAAATELFWRSRILAEIIVGLEMPPQVEEPLRRMLWALDDYEASNAAGLPIARAQNHLFSEAQQRPQKIRETVDENGTLVTKP